MRTQHTPPTETLQPTHPLYHLLHLLTQLLAHYRRPEPAHTTFALALAELLQPARHTIAQLWSLLGFCTFPARAYRLFQRYFDPDRAFRLLFEQMLFSLPADEPLLLVLDSTQVPRTGKRMPGVGLLRAGNTVPFAKGLHKAQRWVGAFTLTPAEHGYRRAIVVSWEPAFPARTTPAPEGAQASEVQRGLELVHRVRAWMDACGRSEQPLVVLGDGAYSAQAFVQGLPARTWAIVRLRADARLCALPEGGRRRVYGARFAPRDIWRARRGQAVPVAGRWREVAVVVRGRERTRQVWFGVCRRWGWGRQVFGCLIVRGRKGVGRAKEQAPMAFLVASGDGDVSELPWGVAQVAEWVWQRWECEVSFREMKSGFGLGEKPCWGRRSGVVSVQWSAWWFGACVWSGYRAWGVCGGGRYQRGWYKLIRVHRVGSKKARCGVFFSIMKNPSPQRARTNLRQGYHIRQLVSDWMPHLPSNQQHTLACLVFALLTLGTLAQSQVSVWLALWTATLPNTWRQRLKRLRQHAWDETACCHALLRAVLRLLRPTELWLAVDATTLRQHHTVLVISVVCHQTAIPVAWRVLPATQRGAWRGEWERLLAQVRRGVPRGLPVYVLADRGLWALWLFEQVRRYGWHPLLRVNPQGKFRACWQRQARPLTDFCPAPGTQVAVEGYAFRYGLRCTLVVFWGASAREPWYLLTDLPASAVSGAWYGLRSWIEQGFRQFKRGGWGWHRTRVVDSGRVFMSWLVYALGQLVVVALGAWASAVLPLWDGACRSLGVYRLGWLVFQAWLLGALEWDVGEVLGIGAGGELK